MWIGPHEFAALRFNQSYEIGYSNSSRDIAKYMDMVGHPADTSDIYFPTIPGTPEHSVDVPDYPCCGLIYKSPKIDVI